MKKTFSIKPAKSSLNDKNQLPAAKNETSTLFKFSGGKDKDPDCCPWLITFLGANVQQTPVLS
ncbi:hypothetical protein [Nibrella saemangeumensis]